MVRPPFWLSVKGLTARVAAGDTSGARHAYREIVVDDCYGMFPYARQKTPNVIVDIGANIGMFSKLCSLLFPQADIYAYEPNPDASQWLRQNADGTRIKVIGNPVSNRAGLVHLDISGDSTQSRVVESGGLTLPAVAASDVADGRPIDFLKMDCEGSEFAILQDPGLLPRTQELCLEYHLFGDKSLDTLRSLVEQGGHRIARQAPFGADPKFGIIHSVRR